MITKFGALYAGCVDIADIGYAGMPAANGRWLEEGHLASAFDKATAIATTMDRLGYHTFWGAEHHFERDYFVCSLNSTIVSERYSQREGYACTPNLLTLFVHLAHLTKQLKFGFGCNFYSMGRPTILAEDYATADILTNGRVRFGIGEGCHSREVETFGDPISDRDARREELFEELAEDIFRAFRAFSQHGKHHDIPSKVPYRDYQLEDTILVEDTTLVPKPKNPVEWWHPVVSASERELNLMAKYGIKGMIGGGVADQVVEKWREVQANHGREQELGGDLVISFSVYIADTEEQAVNEMRLWSNYLSLMTSDNLPTIESEIERGGFFAGPADKVTEKLLEVQERYPGLEEVNIRFTGMGMPESATIEGLHEFASMRWRTSESATIEQLHKFAEGVMPHFSPDKP